MPEAPRQSKKTSLSKTFQDFSFGAEPDAPAIDVRTGKTALPPVSPPPAGPRLLTPEDMDFEPYRGLNPRGGADNGWDAEEIQRQEDEMWEDKRAWEAEQERIFEAAGSMFRKNRPVHGVLELLSNLEMQSVIAAGILDQQYRGRLPDARVNDMMIAALASRAANFDDICGELPPYAVGMVDELRMMADEEEEDMRLLHAANLDLDSKRVLVADMLADMNMTLQDMRGGLNGPSKEDHDALATFLKAASGDVDRGLVRQAVDMFNLISTATDNGTTLRQKPDGEVTISSSPDEADPGPQGTRRAPPKRQPGR
jgi:hypothetical protein